ncbi:hypothetical protein KUCAC02_028828, partial [Chaenocephalus aceratus]
SGRLLLARMLVFGVISLFALDRDSLGSDWGHLLDDPEPIACSMLIFGCRSHSGYGENNTSWRPQSCQECTCYSDVAICRPTYCPNPECDIQRGERLRIPANQCCPECISSSQGSCQYEGVIYAHDSQWSPSPCTACVCSRGSVSCTPHPCSPLSCPSDQSPFTPAGECCPKCGRNGDNRQSTNVNLCLTP